MRILTASRLAVGGFALAAAVLTLLGWLSYRQMVDLREATERVSHSLIVRETTEIVLSLVKDAETGQRGFVITGDPQYLEPYELARGALPDRLGQLRRLTADNIRHQELLERLEGLVRQKLEEVNASVEARRRGGFEGAAPMVRSGEGKRVMDEIRSVVGAMRAEEARLYREEARVEAVKARRATYTDIVGLTVALGLVAVAMLSLSRAVAEREQARAARASADALAAATARSEARLRVTLASIGDAVIATDPSGLVTLMNPVAETLTGWSLAEARGRPYEEVFRIVNARTRAVVESPVARVLREGRVVDLANRTVLLAKDGTEIPIDDSGAPIRDAGGIVLGVVLVFRDVTARQRAEQERADLLARERAARAEAEGGNRARDEFLAMLSHELRNPLGAITNAVTSLERTGQGDDLAVRLHEIIARQAAHLGRLLDDLLDIGRVTAGKLVLQRQPVDLHHVVERALTPFLEGGRASDRRILLSAKPAWVDGDPSRLEQIVTNLVDNAVKYTPAGGTITVAVECVEDLAMVRVADTGFGIAPDMLPRVFDLFAQEDRPLQRPRDGLGIGLTIVRRLAELHGGAVEARSAGSGRGSEFVVRLPLLSPAAAPGRGASERAGVIPRRVLIVEDSEDVRESLRILLELDGHEVVVAPDGSAGLERLQALRPDVALIDFGLPRLDGLTLAARIRATPGGERFCLIALTGYGRPEDRERAVAAGFDAFLVKPVDYGELTGVLARLPTGRSLER